MVNIDDKVEKDEEWEKIKNIFEPLKNKDIKKYGENYLENPDFIQNELKPAIRKELKKYSKGGLKPSPKSIYIPGSGRVPFPGKKF